MTTNGVHKTNGHATPPEANRAPTVPQHEKPVKQLMIYRVQPGDVVHMRTLSERYGGIITHFVQKRSVYCPGEDKCREIFHKHKRVWKGYAAVELYSTQRKKWVPYVLEITQCLELDFRHVWARGQQWELWRLPETAGRKEPVQGKLHDEEDPATYPPEFDVRPPLLHMYGEERLELNAVNPMPPRVFLEESDGDAPKALAAPQESVDQLSPEEYAELCRRAKERFKSPTERKNGPSH